MATPETSGSKTLRILAISLLATLAIAQTACGGAANADSTAALYSAPGQQPTADRLEIATDVLPATQQDVPYGPVTLSATGAEGHVVWSLDGGRLPEGVTLSESGTLSGSAREQGTFEFILCANDDVSEDTRIFTLAVGEFTAVANSDDMPYGAAWSGRPVRITALGATGPVRFRIYRAQTTGHFTNVDELAGTATWIPGRPVGTSAVDQLDVIDVETGRIERLVLDVRRDPFEFHVPRFGVTDVWHIDIDQKFGSHAFRSDWHAALAACGLRGESSTDARGRDCDELADLCCRAMLLQELNKMYLRQPDGRPGAEGLAISFTVDAPEAGTTRPGVGRNAPGAPGRYSRMSLVSIAGTGALGRAMIDGERNPSHEDNSPGGALGPLGVFTNEIAARAAAAYDDHAAEFEQNPLSDADVPHLLAILHDEPSTGSRCEMLRYVLHGLARSLAAVTAHEVGHCLGAHHSDERDSLMYWTNSIHERAVYRFSQEDVEYLRQALPGAGR